MENKTKNKYETIKSVKSLQNIFSEFFLCLKYVDNIYKKKEEANKKTGKHKAKSIFLVF